MIQTLLDLWQLSKLSICSPEQFRKMELAPLHPKHTKCLRTTLICLMFRQKKLVTQLHLEHNILSAEIDNLCSSLQLADYSRGLRIVRSTCTFFSKSVRSIRLGSVFRTAAETSTS